MPVVPNTHDFPTGPATSTEANAYIRDPIRFLLNPPIARMRQTTLQTVTTATFTSATFTVEDFDIDFAGTGGHSTTVNTSRYTAQYPGYYQLMGAACFAASATNQRGTRWAVNGFAVNASAVLLAATSGNLTVVPARVMQVYLQIADYVELQIYQNTGGNLDTAISAEYSCSMDVRWVSN